MDADMTQKPLYKIPVTIDYTDYLGKRSIRRILPIAIRHAVTAWHPELQYLLSAYDQERGEMCEFEMQGIHAWGDAVAKADLAARQTTEASEDSISRARAEERERCAQWHESQLIPEYGPEWGLASDNALRYYLQSNDIHRKAAKAIRALGQRKDTL